MTIQQTVDTVSMATAKVPIGGIEIDGVTVLPDTPLHLKCGATRISGVSKPGACFETALHDASDDCLSPLEHLLVQMSFYRYLLLFLIKNYTQMLIIL